MNYAKIVKIIPLLDSPVDAEALAALRAVSRALLPETFGDVARLIEASLGQEALPEPEAKPFTGFKAAAKGPKPVKPIGDGWIWVEHKWAWAQRPKPMVSRFEKVEWVAPEWTIIINWPEIMTTAMQVMALKLSKFDKARANRIALAAMEEKSINSSDLLWLEQMERACVNV